MTNPIIIFDCFLLLTLAIPLAFTWHVWHEARSLGWNWITEQTRNMYVDAIKTMITASGIAVALIASSGHNQNANNAVSFSTRAAIVCLIACICVSLFAIVALMRGFDRARSRYMDQIGESDGAGTQGRLNSVELLLILGFADAALSCFLAGFAFLGRIAFQF
jgi:cellobiose-specific phosphotransferase system component IIC